MSGLWTAPHLFLKLLPAPHADTEVLQGRPRWKPAPGTEEPGPGAGLTWVQAHELAALLGVLAVLLAPLRPLAQGGHAHLRLPAVAGAA